VCIYTKDIKISMGFPPKDVKITSDVPTSLMIEKHVDFITKFGSDKDAYEYQMTEYLRMSGIYWGLTALDLCGKLNNFDKEEILSLIKSSQHPCGGIGASPNHDPHLLYTLSAVQILVTYDSIGTIDSASAVKYIASLQQEDGSFMGDKWGEIDTRFSFCAIACLKLLNAMDVINVDKATTYILSCMNFDGGFGVRPGSESHAGQIYCCLGALSILKRLHHIDTESLGWWLCERQLPSGGLNGRPEKLPDVCYCWWVLASLKIIGKIDWIDSEKLKKFIFACQDPETGGFTDRPGDVPDPFHTLFALAGLSLLGSQEVKMINPVFCMTQEIIDRMSISLQYNEV
ncbi:hypothetical protein QYM36_010096, partial [Artemia franciscana]